MSRVAVREHRDSHLRHKLISGRYLLRRASDTHTNNHTTFYEESPLRRRVLKPSAPCLIMFLPSAIYGQPLASLYPPQYDCRCSTYLIDLCDSAGAESRILLASLSGQLNALTFWQMTVIRKHDWYEQKGLVEMINLIIISNI